MILIGILASAAAASVSQYQCDLMSYDVLEPATVHRASLRVEHGKTYDIALDTSDRPDLSGRGCDIKDWPAPLKRRDGGIFWLDMNSTQSTHRVTNTALLITEGGDFTVGNLAENNEHFVAVAMCSEEREIRQ